MSLAKISRRDWLVGAAALGAIAAAAPAFAATPIARAWARAEALRGAMAPHQQAVQAALRAGGVPGWMRLKGEAYALGETRYGLLVEILNATPTGRSDLALPRRAALDAEMHDGPRDWAHARVALAGRALPRAA